MIRIDIGCSTHKLPGYFGVDLEPHAGVDVIADLHNLPFADSSIDELHTRHTLEHVARPHKCVEEMFRVCRVGGRIRIIVPHYSNHSYWADMTHLRPFSIRSFEYFDKEYALSAGFPIYLPDVNLKPICIKLVWWPERIYNRKKGWKRWALKAADRVISGAANLNPFLCERFWCWLVGGFYEVDFTLEPKKDQP